MPRRATMRGPRRKKPRVRRARRGASRVRIASVVKTRGARLPLRCLASSLTPIDKNAELLRVRCGREQPTSGAKSRSWQMRLAQGSTASVISGVPASRRTTEPKGPRIIYRLRCSADGKARLASWRGRSIASTILTAPEGPISASRAPRRGKSRPRPRMPNEQPTIR